MNKRTSVRFTSRILTNDSDKQAFALAYDAIRRSKGKTGLIPEEYLGHAVLRGFFKGDEMVAGYGINTVAPFRYESAIPAAACITLKNSGYLVESTSCELTCLWMLKGKVTPFERNAVYFRSVIDTFRAEKRYVIAGSNVQALATIQKRMFPKTLYYGPSAVEGMHEIYYCTRKMLIVRIVAIALIAYPRDLLRMGWNRWLAFFHL